MANMSGLSMVPWGSMMDTNYDTKNYGTVTKKKNISQEGIDKIIYDIMSSDKGLASLGSLENSSGGYGASDKTLMAQDLMAKLAGEIALVTAEETSTTDTNSDRKSPGFNHMGKFADKTGTVICTELVRQGRFSEELYRGGHSHFLSLHPETVRGYHFWAKPIAARMASSYKLSSFFLPIVQSRYEQIVNGKRSLLGSLTIYLGQPICFLIGSVLQVVLLATTFWTTKLTGAFRGNSTEQSA